MPILTAASDRSQRLEHHHISILAECDEVFTFSECGWDLVTGYKGGRRLAYCHFSGDAFQRMLQSAGYSFSGRTLQKMSLAERHKRMASQYAAYNS